MFNIRKLYNGEFINMEYGRLSGNPLIIEKNSKVIAYLWIREDGTNLIIDMIEVVEKEQGYGTEIIYYLFNHFPIETITGNVLLEGGDRAYWFWESLGAELSITSDELDTFSYEEDIYFVLRKSTLIN